MTLRLYADRKGLPLRHVNVRVLHQRGPHDAKDRFAREIVLEGNLTADQRRRLLEIAQRCPVHNTLGRGSDVVSVLAEQPQAGRLEPEPTEQIEHVEHMRAACEE
jgi:putative redox protein